jgi:hypothetical protein
MAEPQVAIGQPAHEFLTRLFAFAVSVVSISEQRKRQSRV